MIPFHASFTSLLAVKSLHDILLSLLVLFLQNAHPYGSE